jgi:hypothetical protein
MPPGDAIKKELLAQVYQAFQYEKYWKWLFYQRQQL